jgi:beta-glucanase (GH16 family)
MTDSAFAELRRRGKLPPPTRFLIALLLTASLCLIGAAPASAAWQLASADYFSGTRVDLTRWYVYNGIGNQGHGLRRPAQVTVSNGRLVITARMINGVLNSGGLAHRTNRAYGRFEFLARTDADPSAATSGAILTWPESGSLWRDGENDIYETGSAADRNPFYSFIHFGGNLQYNIVHYASATQWHKMVLEWEPSVMRIYRDGILVRTITNASAIPDSRHHLTIQLDAVKNWMSSTVRMYVEYVRIYRRV